MFLWVKCQSTARVARECVVYILKCSCSTLSWAGEDGKEFGYLQNPPKNEMVQIKSESCICPYIYIYIYPHALQWMQNSLAFYHSPLQLKTVQHGQGALMESDVRYKNLRATGNLSSQATVINYLISVSLN